MPPAAAVGTVNGTIGRIARGVPSVRRGEGHVSAVALVTVKTTSPWSSETPLAGAIATARRRVAGQGDRLAGDGVAVDVEERDHDVALRGAVGRHLDRGRAGRHQLRFERGRDQRRLRVRRTHRAPAEAHDQLIDVGRAETDVREVAAQPCGVMEGGRARERVEGRIDEPEIAPERLVDERRVRRPQRRRVARAAIERCRSGTLRRSPGRS